MDLKGPADITPVYLQVDSRGGAYRLFPNPRYHTSENPVPAQKDLVLPNVKEVYFLDETRGKEEIYLFASNTRIPSLETMESGPMTQLREKGIRIVGRAGVKPTNGLVRTERVDFRGLLEELSATGHFYHRIEIEHR